MPRPVVHDEQVRRDLLEAAARQLSETGLEALSLRRVAGAAGTSTTAIYTLFGDKAGLVEAVAVEAERSFRASQFSVPVTDDALADLGALGHAYRGWALDHPSWYAVMFDGRIPGPPVGGESAAGLAVAPSIAPLVSAVTRACAAGRLGGAEPEGIVLSIWAMIHGLVSLELAAGDKDDAPLGTSSVGAALANTADEYIAAMARAWTTPQR